MLHLGTSGRQMGSFMPNNISKIIFQIVIKNLTAVKSRIKSFEFMLYLYLTVFEK